LLVRNLTIMLCATAEGITCSLIVITADKTDIHAVICYNSNR